MTLQLTPGLTSKPASKLSLGTRSRRTLSRTLRPLQVAGRRALLNTADTLALLHPANPDPRRVLLVRLDNIGDFVLWLDAGRALAEHLRQQGKHITLLAGASWASLALKVGLFDEVQALDPHLFTRNLVYRHRLLTSLRAARFGTVIQPTRNRVPETGDAIVRVLGATQRIGFAAPGECEHPSRAAGQTSLYTRLLTPEPEAQSEMQANASFVRQLTGRHYQAQVADLHAALEGEPLGDLAEALPSSPYVVLFPGASEPGRQWPQQNFAALAQRCREQTGLPVLICGGPGDLEVAAKVVTAAGPGVRSLAGRTSLTQLAAVIANATLLVSNDTSAIHIAAAVGVPSVCIVGGGHFGRFLPYNVEPAERRPLPVVAAHPMDCFGCNWVCKFHPARGKPMPCIEGVSVDTVWNLSAPLLHGHALRRQACTAAATG